MNNWISLSNYPVDVLSLINEYIKDEYIYITQCKFTRTLLHIHTYFPLHLKCREHVITEQKINVIDNIRSEPNPFICEIHHFINHKDHIVIHVYVDNTNRIISVMYDDTLLHDIWTECIHSWASLNFI